MSRTIKKEWKRHGYKVIQRKNKWAQTTIVSMNEKWKKYQKELGTYSEFENDNINVRHNWMVWFGDGHYGRNISSEPSYKTFNTLAEAERFAIDYMDDNKGIW